MKLTPLEENWLALSMVDGVGQKTVRLLLNRFGEVGTVLDLPPDELCRLSGVSPAIANRIHTARETPAFNIERRLIADHGIHLVTLESDQYPSLLRETDIPPPVLYVRGQFPFPEGIYISVVGTRRFTRYGERITRQLIRDLATMAPDVVIVSGLARGIDTVAHQEALNCGLNTIAVMAGGLTSVYPPENADLAERITGQGALVTEFPMAMPPIAKNFPIRNRVISGLSSGILVVEAGEKSGALITAGFAISHNREIFAVPGEIDAPNSMGTNRLIQRGQAKLVREAADILEELSTFRRAKPSQLELLEEGPLTIRSNAATPKGEKGRVIETLRRGPLHPDDLAQETGLPMEILLGLLLELELSGDIVQNNENRYVIS